MHQALLHLSISGRTVDSPYYSEEFVPFLMPFDALWHVKHNNLHKTHGLSKLPCYKQLQDQQSHWSDAIKHTCPLSMAIYGQTAHPIQLHVLEPERASAVGLPLESSPLGSIPRPPLAAPVFFRQKSVEQGSQFLRLRWDEVRWLH